MKKKDFITSGWEDVTKKLTGKVWNPRAVAEAMAKRGYSTISESGKPHDVAALLRRFTHDGGKVTSLEENASTTLGQLLRPGAKFTEAFIPALEVAKQFPPPLDMMVRAFTPMREAARRAGDEEGESGARVVIISEGPGNQKDRNWYTAEAIRAAVPLFEGARCFLNHATESEEEQRPERDVHELCGWYSDVEDEIIDDTVTIIGTLNFTEDSAGGQAKGKIKSALKYATHFPGRTLVGFSIDANGIVHRGQMKGELYNIVDKLFDVKSVDLVTFPARGGRVLQMNEAWQNTFERELI